MAVFQEVEISEIVTPPHRRETDPSKVKTLAQSIEDGGLLQPIGITPDKTLIFGRHRLEAHRLLGRDRIPATIHDLSRLRAEMAEIDENLERSPLTPLQVANALKRRKEIYEELYPETKRGKAGGHAKHGSATAKMAFVDDAADKTGKSARTIQREVALAQRIPGDVQERIAHKLIAKRKNELEKLSRLPEHEQRRVGEILASDKAESVDEALGRNKPNANDRPETAALPAQAERPNSEHNSLDPEDGACTQSHEPDVVLPEPAEIPEVELISEDEVTQAAEPEADVDGDLESNAFLPLDKFLEKFELYTLKRISRWHKRYPTCPWRLIADGLVAMAQRIGKSVRA